VKNTLSGRNPPAKKIKSIMPVNQHNCLKISIYELRPTLALRLLNICKINSANFYYQAEAYPFSIAGCF